MAIRTFSPLWALASASRLGSRRQCALPVVSSAFRQRIVPVSQSRHGQGPRDGLKRERTHLLK